MLHALGSLGRGCGSLLLILLFLLNRWLLGGWQERRQEDRRNEGRDPTSSHLIKDGSVIADLFCLYSVDDMNRWLSDKELGQHSEDPKGLFPCSIYTTQADICDLPWNHPETPRRVSTASQAALITPRKGCHVPGATESGRVATSQTEPFAFVLLLL